jgi:transcription initiation factor IIE alpha subunit
MIQQYKHKLQYWVATRIGDLETAQKDHIAEIICPDCGMKTALDSTLRKEQSCYFCNGNLIEDSEEITVTGKDSKRPSMHQSDEYTTAQRTCSPQKPT